MKNTLRYAAINARPRQLSPLQRQYLANAVLLKVQNGRLVSMGNHFITTMLVAGLFYLIPFYFATDFQSYEKSF